jgi:ArsR family transcriptional regulator
MPRHTAQWLKALADETRLRILALVAKQPLSVQVLADRLRVRQPKVSRHLAYLVQNELVTASKQGRFVYYGLAMPTDRHRRVIVSELLRRMLPPR